MTGRHEPARARRAIPERAKHPKTDAVVQGHEVWDAAQLRMLLDAVSTHRLYASA